MLKKSQNIAISLNRRVALSITSSTTTIDEGGSISYRITSDFRPSGQGNFVDITLKFSANVSTSILPITSASGVNTPGVYRINAGTSHRDLVYNTNIDSDSVDDVQLTISIVPSFTGGVSTGKPGESEIVVTVNNVSPSAISISKSSSLTSITEGGSFEIMLTATPAPESALPITLTTSDGNKGYFERFDPSSIMMPTSGMLTVTVYTKVLPAQDSSTNFRVSVGSDLTNMETNLRYGPATGSGFVDVVILNSDKPLVQITSTAHERNVVESTGFTFTLMVTPAPPTDEVFSITLALNPTTITPPPPPTPYLDANFKLTYDIDSTGMLDVWVPTKLLGDDVDGDTIEIRIVENTDKYLIRNNYHNVQFAIAKIADTSEPIISITSDADGESIGESKGFMFRLRANKALETDLDVNLTISDSGFIEPDLTNPFTIPTSGTLDVPVMTQANVNSDEGGEIEISIAEHPSYHISGRENQISITILNISTVASISAGDGPHPEGSTITFTIESSAEPANPVTITVMVSETDGDNILTSSPLTMQVALSPTETENTVSFQTVKNGIHMLGGSLTVSMTTTNTDIAVGPSISVAVEDADVTPVISISTQATSVLEGGTDDVEGVEVTLTANNSVSNMELPITLEIDDGDHNFFANANPNPVVVNLLARERSVTHAITPENDEVKEAPGEFTVTIQVPSDDTNFTVADAPRNMVSIQFVDDDIMDLPEVSVSSVSANITEGTDDNATFNLMVTPVTTTSLSIRYLIAVSGDYLQNQANNIGEKTEIISFENGEFSVALPIDDEMDDEAEPNGIITFELLYETADLTYRIKAENDTAEVTVTDNDGGQNLPLINISVDDSVVEGEDITFTLTATTIDNVPLTADLTIVLSVTQTGSFLAKDAGTRDVMIPMTIGFKDLVEQTIWLENRSSSGTITAEVQADSASPPYLLTRGFV